MLVTTVDIAGLPCEIHRVRMKSHDGLCYSQRMAGDKGIRINSDLKGRALVETIIHEILHRADYDKTELWVAHVAERCADVLFTPPFDELLEHV